MRLWQDLQDPPAKPDSRPHLCYVDAMATIPLDQGPGGRRRVGPFWLEEGTPLVVFGALLLTIAVAFYVFALVSH